MTRRNPADDPDTDGGRQVPARPHDSGSAANETEDGLDASTEALRHATEDTPSGATPDDVEKTPVFDRADLAPNLMARKQRGPIVETPTEARQAESGRPVLSLLVVSLCLGFLTLAGVWYVFFRT